MSCACLLSLQIGLYAQLHKYEVYPPNQTAYGTPRRFRAMIANIATSNSTALQKLNGTVSFQDGLGQALCNASIVNNQTAFKSQVTIPVPLGQERAPRSGGVTSRGSTT